MLILQGDVDHWSARELTVTLRHAVKRPQTLLLDMAGVGHLDSGMITALLYYLRPLPAEEWLGLIAPSVHVHRILEIGGLFQLPQVRLFADRAAAEKAVQERIEQARTAE